MIFKPFNHKFWYVVIFISVHSWILGKRKFFSLHIEGGEPLQVST